MAEELHHERPSDHRALLCVLAICLVCLPSLAPRLAGAARGRAAGPVLTIKAPTANVRSGPGVAYPLIGSARKGQQFPITGRIAGNAWWQVTFKGKPAWIAASVAAVSADATSAAIVTQIPPPPAKSTAAAAPSSPGAGRIVFAQGRGDETDVALLDVATGKISVPASNGRQPDIRQDGNIVFNGQGGGKENLFTVQPDGSFLTQISRFAEDSHPQWAINAPAIIYQSTAGVSRAAHLRATGHQRSAGRHPHVGRVRGRRGRHAHPDLRALPHLDRRRQDRFQRLRRVGRRQQMRHLVDGHGPAQTTFARCR